MAKKKQSKKVSFSEKIEKLDLLQIVQIGEPPALVEVAEHLAASKEWRFVLSYAEIVAILKDGEFGELKLVPWGSNYTFIAPLCTPQGQEDSAVIYKPRNGEAPLWDFEGGTLYKREHAAYLVSKALNWHIIPPVIVRDGPHGVGTVQLFVDVDERKQYYDFRDKHAHELMRIAIFDYITNNADRKASHCLLGADNFLWFIDHGLCFNSVDKLRTVIWDYAGQVIPPDIIGDLSDLMGDVVRLKALRSQLSSLLRRREVDLFFERIESILTNPSFPYLTSRRSVPWAF